MSSLKNMMEEMDINIHTLQNCLNNTLRVKPKEGPCTDAVNNLFSMDKTELTLNEIETPAPFHFYDYVDIDIFSWQRGADTLQLDVYASFNIEQCEMRFIAHFLDQHTQKHYADVELNAATHASVFTSRNNISLADTLGSVEMDNVAVIVECKILDFLGRTTHLLMLKKLDISEVLFAANNVELSPLYTHIYPKKEQITVVFGDAITGKLPATYHHDMNNIVISLRRAPEQSGDSDYVCNYNSRDYYPYLAIPAKGVIQLGRSVQITAVRNRMAHLEKISSGGVAPITAQKFVSDIIDKGMLQFELQTNWETLLKQTGQLVPQSYNFTLSFDVDYQLPAGKPQTLKFTLSSKAMERIRSGERIQEPMLPLKIMWGCLAADTRVTMADGQTKRIADIRIGDKVLSGKESKAATVENIWRGVEENLICIETENGMTLKATGEHPVIVRKESGMGYKRAQSLLPGDRLYCTHLTVSEWTGARFVYVTPYNDIVYNLSLDNPDGFYANGILVGDMNNQNDGGF